MIILKQDTENTLPLFLFSHFNKSRVDFRSIRFSCLMNLNVFLLYLLDVVSYCQIRYVETL